MPRIMPITVLRDTTEISNTCHELEEPIFITKNGHGDMVVMSIETYERNLALADIYTKLAEAENDIKNGRVRPAREVFEELKTEYGF
ncbi:MAG: type II toxin-antitoxin system Phd/YefM family antitoxin [Oscillospiraceae bacterium]|nr:type II toxin-antitoxin system Phd/YefM family antitoxin [Oscillospiraceae bacterium]